jgi:hypothetical protein
MKTPFKPWSNGLHRLRRLGSLGLCLAASACTAWHPDMQDMTVAYENAISTHQRQVILLNLLRASDKLPLSFSTIATWTGSAGLTSSTGMSGQLFGQMLSNAGISSSLDVRRDFNFTLASLDNAEFMQGFFADLPLERFHVFASSADQEPLIFYTLLVAAISLNPEADDSHRWNNQPDARNFQAFQTGLHQLLAVGLRTEIKHEQQALGPAMNTSQALEFVKFNYANLKPPTQLLPEHRDGQVIYQNVATDLSYRFCFAAPPQPTAWAISPAIRCASPKRAAPAPQPGAPLDAITVDLRSTRDVFKYLGGIVHQQRAVNPSTAAVTGKPLLRIVKGKPAAGAPVIASASYQGETYFVPLDDASHSAAVFDILSTLLTMNKIPGAIPASPGILIR